MPDIRPTPTPDEKEPAEGGRHTVDQAIADQDADQGPPGAPSQPTVEQELAEG